MAAPNASRSISRRSAPIASSAAPSSISSREWSTCQTCSAARARRCANDWARPLAGNIASTWSRILSPTAPAICRRPKSHSPIAGWRCSRGGARIAALAKDIGWSRKHLVNRFRSELGLAPKPIARMMRFHRGLPARANGNRSRGWAGIAAESGYADQAHLVREFGELAGETPTAWARRLALIDSRLTRPNEALSVSERVVPDLQARQTESASIQWMDQVTNLQADAARISICRVKPRSLP